MESTRGNWTCIALAALLAYAPPVSFAQAPAPAQDPGDARHCLDLGNIAEIVRCAEPYRGRRAPPEEIYNISGNTLVYRILIKYFQSIPVCCPVRGGWTGSDHIQSTLLGQVARCLNVQTAVQPIPGNVGKDHSA